MLLILENTMHMELITYILNFCKSVIAIIFDNDYLTVIYKISLAIGVLHLSFAIYWLFFIPCNWTKSLNNTNYHDTSNSTEYFKSYGKRSTINRLRKIGIHDLPPPFPNGWYSILESSNLKKGEVKCVSCLGEQFAVYRTMKNEVHVLDAFCPHMGANIGIGGRVIGENIQCPFHKWTFRGNDGKCVDVPYSSRVLEGVKIKKWISYECNDNIFVWYHAEKDETPWKLPEIKEIQDGNLKFHGRNEFYVHCHIQEIPENGADFAHFQALHKASFLAGGTPTKESPFANFANHQWKAIWQPSENHNHFAFVTLTHSIELLSKFHIFQMNVTGIQIGPSVVHLHVNSKLFGSIEILQTITPIEPLVQKVIHRFYSRRYNAPFIKFMIIGESIMFERDMHVWNHKKYQNKPLLVKEEASIKSFRNWYQQFYTQNSKTFIEAKEDINW